MLQEDQTALIQVFGIMSTVAMIFIVGLFADDNANKILKEIKELREEISQKNTVVENKEEKNIKS